MALDLSALTNYTKENADVLLARSYYSGRTLDLISSEGNVQTGIKTSEKIGILSTDTVFQSGDNCGFNASGTTRITQRTITVGSIAIHEQLCPKDLEKKYTQLKMKAGSDPKEIYFEQKYTELKALGTAEKLEVATWQGDTASSNPNLNKFDGLIKLIDNAGLAVNGNPTGITVATGITESNVKAIARGMWQKLPAALKGQSDIRIFCGWDFFELFIGVYTDQNLYHFSPTGKEVAKGAGNGEVIIPGTSYVLTAVHGLDGTNRLFALRMSNMWQGVDMENEEEKFEMWYSQDDRVVKYVNEFKNGVQVAFPDEIVSFKLVP